MRQCLYSWFAVIGLFMLNTSFAFTCNSPYKDGGCYQSAKDPCITYPASCDSADEGWRYNDCMSYSEYREAFGNIGAR